jgi:hypothetical protein
VVWAGERSQDPVTVPEIGSTVDIANASYSNDIGAVELVGTWTDPEFDPSLDTFYYARALEIPTPCWTTIQAEELGVAPPEVVAVTVQERAWSSSIWSTRAAEARRLYRHHGRRAARAGRDPAHHRRADAAARRPLHLAGC